MFSLLYIAYVNRLINHFAANGWINQYLMITWLKVNNCQFILAKKRSTQLKGNTTLSRKIYEYVIISNPLQHRP